MRNEIDLPGGLEELVKKYSTAPDWESECRKAYIELNQLKVKQEQNLQDNISSPEKPLHKKEKDSIYKMLASSLAEIYGLDEVKNRNVKAKEVLDDLLAKHGVELDEDIDVKLC